MRAYECVRGSGRGSSGREAPRGRLTGGSRQNTDTPADDQTGGRSEASFCEVGGGAILAARLGKEEPILRDGIDGSKGLLFPRSHIST